jgi:hypothetical protein
MTDVFLMSLGQQLLIEAIHRGLAAESLSTNVS